MDIQTFYSARHTFAIIDGKLRWADEDSSNEMQAHSWICGRRGVSEAGFEKTVRGAVWSDRVTFCCGSKYEPCNMDEIPKDIFQEVITTACKMNGVDSIHVYNGHEIGTPGTRWKSIQDLGTFRCND